MDGDWHYEMFLGEAASHVYAERFLIEDVDDDSVVAKLERWNFHEPTEFRQALTTLRLRRPLEQNLYSYMASRTDLLPYQFKPVLKFLRSPYGRMFIADEVGLGKTIEAGIIMLELAARIRLRRVLVVCPPALRHKWRAEMDERFDQAFEILDRQRAIDLLGDPALAEAPVKAIASLALLRSEDLVELVAESEARFDLVVVDESHHLQNPETASHRLGEQLSAVADHMLMLSATPLSLSADNLFHQLNILVPDEFFDPREFHDRIAPNRHLNQAIRALRHRPPLVDNALQELRAIEHMPQGHLFIGNPFYRDALATLSDADGELDSKTKFQLVDRLGDLNTIGHVFTRTRKREVGDPFPARRAAVVPVRLTDEERDFYDAVTEFVRKQAGQMANLLVVMPQRQVASSIPAAREYLRERARRIVDVEDDFAGEITADEDIDPEAPQFDDEEWQTLAPAWRAVEGIDSKYDAFERTIAMAIEDGTASDGKILVFSFFQKTIEHLERRLRYLEIVGAPIRVSILYGPTPAKDRHEIANSFRNEPGPHVVLASEIAAEGLDFEFVNVMVNYDLPWNPMKVEQRIGRLDRHGQEADVIHIVNFSIEGTIEERILERLYMRIGIFETAIGDLESILGSEIESLTRELLRLGRTAEEEEDLIEQSAENIVRRREEAERFEHESRELLGQDDVFAEQLHRIERDHRFVGPYEIRNFVTVALKTWSRRIKIGVDGARVTISVPSSGDLRQLMKDYLDRHPERAGPKAWRAVSRAMPGANWDVTFDPEFARQNREIDFVTLQHPLVGALLNEEPEVVRPVAALRLRSGEHRPGSYFFFLYLLDIQSFRSGLELMAAVVNPSGQVDEQLSSQLIGLIPQVPADGGSSFRPDEAAVETAATAASEWVTRHIREREAELIAISDQVVDQRTTSLQESFQRWLEHREELLRTAKDQRIARLHAGYIRHRKADLQEKLRELENQRSVQIGRELVAGGILEIDSDSAA